MKRNLSDILLLTATSLLMRGIGVLFSSFLNRKIGPVGVGTYSLLMSVYSLFITFAVSGVRLAAGRLCTRESALGRSPFSAARGCMVYSLGFGVLSGAVLSIFAVPVAAAAVSKPQCAPCLRILALCLPFIAVGNALYGFFVSQNMLPMLSVISVGEQLCKIFFSTLILEITPNLTEIQSCTALVIGNALGETVSFLILGSVYLYKSIHSTLPQAKVPLKEVYLTALPLGVSYYLRNGLSTAEQLLIPRGLRAHGGSVDATIGVYGTIHGLVFPAVMLPIAPIDSAGELLLSRLTCLQTKGQKGLITKTVAANLRLTFGYSVFVCTFFCRYHTRLAELIYQNQSLGSLFLILCPLVVLYYTDNMADSMLKGLGCQLASMRYSMLDSVLGVSLIFLLLPKYGIAGYVVSLYLTKLINLTLSVSKLMSVSGHAVSFFRAAALTLPCLCLLLPDKGDFWVSAPLFTVLYMVLFTLIYRHIKRQPQ